MKPVWREGSEKYQKIVISVLAMLTVGLAFFMFSHDFVAEPDWLIFSIYFSGFSILCSVVFFIRLYLTGVWDPAPAWFKYSKAKNFILLLSVPIFFFVIFWINIAVSLPHAFTVVFGAERVLEDLVEKNEIHSRRSCDYRLELKSVSPLLFHYCISKEFYSQLPDGEIVSELFVKQSIFGYSVEEIRVQHRKY